jgi:hypothetical protein
MRFVFETLPIISHSHISKNQVAFVAQAPVGVLAGIYALALPFISWDEKLCLDNAYSTPKIEALWQISFACLQEELQFPRLSTVQIFLLLLNQLPFDAASVESPFFWSLSASMVAAAQSLGLHLDPVHWDLPPSEMRLRRRLWWSVFVEHTWRAVTHGRPSMLHDDDWDVSPLASDDFSTCADDDYVHWDDLSQSDAGCFIALCSLSKITSDIHRKFL